MNSKLKLSVTPQPIVRLMLVMVGFFLYLLQNDYQTKQYYDANEYWELSTTFFKDGNFSLLHFFSPLRGYSYPLLNVVFQGIRKGLHLPLMTVVKLQGAGWAALLFGVVLPAFWQQLAGPRFRLSWGNWLALVMAGFVFWRDHFSFTLSDMPAITLLLLGLLGLARPRLLTWFGAGGALALALNMRPVYAASVPVVFGLALVLLRKQDYHWSHAGMFLGAFSLVLLPQLFINLKNTGRFTPAVLSQVEELGVRRPLYEWHLAHGMRIQKFEVMVPPPGRFSLMGIATDPAGRKLLVAVNDNQPFTKMSDYVTQVLTHPLQFGALYGRHLFNGLDVRFPTPYVSRLTFGTLLLPLINYTLLFWGVLALGRLPWRRNRLLWWQIGSLLVAVTAALPVVMECRFMLPLHLLLLTAALMGTPWRAITRRLRRCPQAGLRLLPAYIVWLMVGLMLTTTAEGLTVFGRYVMDIT